MKERKNADLKKKPHYLGHRERLKERFASAGGAALKDYEILELLLFYSIPRKDIKELAKNLVTHFGGIGKIFSAGHKELCSIEGMSSSSALLICLSRELWARFSEKTALEGDVLNSPELVANFARAKIGHREEEVLMAIYLNAKNRICGYDFISEGTTDCAVVYPRKIVKKAIEKNACGIIISHNHPSGECEPSADDISLTRKAKEAAQTVDIRVLDHIVVGKSGYFSFIEKKIPF